MFCYVQGLTYFRYSVSRQCDLVIMLKSDTVNIIQFMVNYFGSTLSGTSSLWWLIIGNFLRKQRISQRSAFIEVKLAFLFALCVFTFYRNGYIGDELISA